MRTLPVTVFLLFGLLVGISSCFMVREDLYDAHNGSGGTEVDTPGITVDVIDGLITKEDLSLSDTFTVVLDTEPSAAVTIGTIQSLDPGEATVSPSSLTFTITDWDIPQTVTVTGVDDAITDGMQTAVIDLGTASGGDYEGLDPGDVVVSNLDDEVSSSPAVIVLTGDGLITAEDPVTPLSDTFQVVLNSQPASDVSIGTISSTDISEVTVNPISITFSTANWDIPVTVTVTGVDDLENDGMKTVNINLGSTTSADANWDGMVLAPVSVHNLDNDAPKGISVIAGSQLMVSESGSECWFEVVLDSEPSAQVDISVATNDTTEGTITSPASGMLSFIAGNWDTPQTVIVTGVDDFEADGDTSFSVVLGAAVSADTDYSGMNPTDVAFLNIDNETPGVTVYAGSSMLVSENGSSTFFEIVLNSEPSSSVTVNVSSTDTGEGTVAPGVLSFDAANWDTAQTLSVSGVDDPAADWNQPFSINISTFSTDTDYNGLLIPSVEFTCVDDDFPGMTVSAGTRMLVTETGGASEFELVLNSEPSDTVTVNVTSSNTLEGDVTAGAVLSFDSANWSAPQTVTVTGIDDHIADGNINFTVSCVSSSPDADYNGLTKNIDFTNIDDNTPGVTVNAGSRMIVTESGSYSEFMVVLNSEPLGDVEISVSSDTPAEGLVTIPAGGILTFTSTDWFTAQLVRVTGQDDAAVDGNQNFRINFSATSLIDSAYDGIVISDVDFLNIDDDSAVTKTITVVAGSSTLVSENGGESSFQIVLSSAPTDDVTIHVSSSDTTEGQVTDPPTGDVIFTPADWTPKTVTVTGQDDDLYDENMTFQVILGNASSLDGDYNGLAPSPNSLNFECVDDETPGITVSAGSSLLVSESDAVTGGSCSFEVVLNSEPTDDVTINVSSGDITEGDVLTGTTLTFTDLNWSAPQTVTVAGIDDFIVDGNQGFSIILDPDILTADPHYNGLDPDDVSFTCVDDDAPGITVDIGDGLITAEDPVTPLQDTFTIVLNSEPTDSVDISITSTDTNEAEVVDPNPLIGFVTFTTADWFTPKTITLTGVDDWLVDSVNPKTIEIKLGPASSATDTDYDTMLIDSVYVHNLDDEIPPEVIILGPSNELITTDLVTTENGGTAEFKVLLNSAPTADVDITISSSLPSEGTLIPADPLIITFTPSDWNVAQRITIAGVDDMVPDTEQFYTIDLGSTASADPFWDMIPAGSISVVNKPFITMLDYGWSSAVAAGSFTSIGPSGTGKGTPLSFVDTDPLTDSYPPEDEGYQFVEIGFPFYYMGMRHTRVVVYTNGYMIFSPYPNTINTFVNGILFADRLDPTDGEYAIGFENAIAPWWDDLNVGDVGSGVYFETIGPVGNRVLTIEWENTRCTTGNDIFTFQIKLYEADFSIEFIYGASANGSGNASACMGIRDDTGGVDRTIDAFDGNRTTVTSSPFTSADRGTGDYPVADTIIQFLPMIY
jgi:hypothetical protein